jgi:hypothetical protein
MIISLGADCSASQAVYPEVVTVRTDPRQLPHNCVMRRYTAPCLTLLLVGFTEPSRSPGLLVSSYLAISPLPCGGRTSLTSYARIAGRYTFCCTFPDLAAGGCYPSPRPTEPGLSSRRNLFRPIWRPVESRPAIIQSTPNPLITYPITMQRGRMEEKDE